MSHFAKEKQEASVGNVFARTLEAESQGSEGIEKDQGWGWAGSWDWCHILPVPFASPLASLVPGTSSSWTLRKIHRGLYTKVLCSFHIWASTELVESFQGHLFLNIQGGKKNLWKLQKKFIFFNRQKLYYGSWKPQQKTEQRKSQHSFCLGNRSTAWWYMVALCFSWGWLLIDLQFSRTFWMVTPAFGNGGGCGQGSPITSRQTSRGGMCCGWAHGLAASRPAQTAALSLHFVLVGFSVSNLFSLPQFFGCKMVFTSQCCCER